MPAIHPHIVGKVNLELRFTGEQYDKSLVKKVKEAVLERVNSALSKIPEKSGTYLSIDRLDIELNIPDLNVFPNMFEDRLTEILNEKIKVFRISEKKEDVNEFSIEERLWQHFLHYLKFGYLPWSAGSAELLELNEVLQLFHGEGSEYRIMALTETLKESRAADRFCHELPLIFLHEILRNSESELSKGYRRVEILANKMFGVFPEHVRSIKSHKEIFTRWIFSASLKINELSNKKEESISREILRIAFSERMDISVVGKLVTLIEGAVKELLVAERSLIELRQKSSGDKERLILRSLHLYDQGLIELGLNEKQKKNLEKIDYPKRISNDRIKVNKEDNEEEKSSEANDSDHRIYIDNAGLILLHPYLLSLFQELGFCDHQSFYSKHDRQLAVVVLQKIAGLDIEMKTGLALNKILCGLKMHEVIPTGIQLENEWDKEFDKLLISTINNWKALKNTSIEGFRISFLQRKGILEINQDSQKLFVEKKPYDVLLERLPWSIGLIKLPWMSRPLWVDW
jgi:hypothetical protein